MSQRFYINGEQIFGNNEMFQNTHDEIARQGGVWDDVDLCLPETEITDPQGLMDAVEQDTFEYLKRVTTEDVYDEESDERIKHKDFSKVHDKELAYGNFEDDIKSRIYTRDGKLRPHIWMEMCWWIQDKRFLTSYNLYQAIKNDVWFNEKQNKLVLKDGGKIIAEMY